MGEPALILGPGTSPHEHALRPSEAAAPQEAEAVFWMGPALTPWLGGAIGLLAGDARAVALLKAEGTAVLGASEGAVFGGAHEDGGAHDHAGGADPHAWLDPANAALWLDVVADALAQIDPVNA